MTNNTWHYQLMRSSIVNAPDDVRDYYAIHEYYPLEDGSGYTEAPCPVDGYSVEEVKQVLLAMLEDIERHGVKDCE